MSTFERCTTSCSAWCWRPPLRFRRRRRFAASFVFKGGGPLLNRSSQVIIARDGNRSVFTMMNDYQDNVKDFAWIVSVPMVPRRQDIRIGNPSIINKLDAYSAPRLVEYFGENPCAPVMLEQDAARPQSVPAPAPLVSSIRAGSALGVRVEATYLCGEGYQLPPGADEMLGGSTRGGMKFFVVRIIMQRFDRSCGGFL